MSNMHRGRGVREKYLPTSVCKEVRAFCSHSVLDGFVCFQGRVGIGIWGWNFYEVFVGTDRLMRMRDKENIGCLFFLV